MSSPQGIRQNHGRSPPSTLFLLGADEPMGEASGGLESVDLKHQARPSPGLLRHRWVVSSPVERGL